MNSNVRKHNEEFRIEFKRTKEQERYEKFKIKLFFIDLSEFNQKKVGSGN